MIKFAGVQKLLVKNSPTILTGMAVTGLFVTIGEAIKATPKALEILGEEQVRRKYEGITDEYELIPKLDVVKLTWKCYIPTAVLGLMTVGCIVGSNSINLRRNAALIGVYTLSEAALKEYKAKVVETLGKPKERQIREDIAMDRIIHNPISDNEIIMTNRGETLCYDALSGRYFKSDIEHIRQILNKLSRQLMSEEVITLNEVYSELDLKGTKLGESMGWHIDDGLIEPDFSSHLTDNGIPCLVLDYVTEPRYNYNH